MARLSPPPDLLLRRAVLRHVCCLSRNSSTAQSHSLQVVLCMAHPRVQAALSVHGSCRVPGRAGNAQIRGMLSMPATDRAVLRCRGQAAPPPRGAAPVSCSPVGPPAGRRRTAAAPSTSPALHRIPLHLGHPPRVSNTSPPLSSDAGAGAGADAPHGSSHVRPLLVPSAGVSASVQATIAEHQAVSGSIRAWSGAAALCCMVAVRACDRACCPRMHRVCHSWGRR